MMKIAMKRWFGLVICGCCGLAPLLSAAEVFTPNSRAERWREQNRFIDMHMHVDYQEAHMTRAVKIMDEVGIGIGVNLSGGFVTSAEGEMSEFEKNKALADRLFPGRFINYMSLNFNGWDEPDFAEKAVQQLEKGYRLGAAGLKEYKRLGLFYKNKDGNLIKIDDPKLDPVWKRCGELGMPVSIHVADPLAFWAPYNESNERWEELKDHPSWWFGDPEKYPSREELLAARNRVVARHPETTFVCVHFANNPEDIDAVDKWLDQYPNMMVDLAARIPELGRHNPRKVHDLFIKHQDRILFGTDFMVYSQLILGSGGSGPAPTDEDAVNFYEKQWRWLETWDRDFEHMTPIQGNWTISGIQLPAGVLRKIYFENARKLLARSLPAPSIQAQRIEREVDLEKGLRAAPWRKAEAVRMVEGSLDRKARPEMATAVRALWSDQFLYIGFRAPYTELTTYSPADPAVERDFLWEKDVVEAFIDSDPDSPKTYREFEVAPNGEWVDLAIDLEADQFDRTWDSGFSSEVSVSEDPKIWTAVMRIPWDAFPAGKPQPGAQWKVNFYRCDRAKKAFLAWNPTGVGSFHHPAAFGTLRF
jgi:predicted TIM-barrel fold metal-dependent hydrolase